MEGLNQSSVTAIKNRDKMKTIDSLIAETDASAF